MRVLIELPTWLGDTVMSTPAIENLIAHYRNSEIFILGPSVSTQVFKYHPKISETIVLDKKYFSLFKLRGRLGTFDIFFSFRGSLRSTILMFFIKSNKKYQYQTIVFLY